MLNVRQLFVKCRKCPDTLFTPVRTPMPILPSVISSQLYVLILNQNWKFLRYLLSTYTNCNQNRQTSNFPNKVFLQLAQVFAKYISRYILYVLIDCIIILVVPLTGQLVAHLPTTMTGGNAQAVYVIQLWIQHFGFVFFFLNKLITLTYRNRR